MIAFLLAPIPALSAFDRRRGKFMLPLLLATRLTPRQIVWQSFAASVVPALALWLCMVPFLALISIWWGLDPVDLTVVVAVTLSALATSVALAVACSLWTNGTLSATFSVYGVLLGWLYGTVLLADAGVLPLAWLSIVNPLLLIWPPRPGGPTPSAIAIFVGATAAFTIALLELAAATFRRCVLARGAAKANCSARARRCSPRRGSPSRVVARAHT